MVRWCAAFAALIAALFFFEIESIAAQPAPDPSCDDGIAEVPGDSTKVQYNALKHAFYSLLFAPPLLIPLLDVPCEQQGSSLGFWTQNVSVSLSPGYLTNGDQKHAGAYDGGGHIGSIEFLVHGFYGEFRIERYSIEDDVTLRTYRLGYLTHPLPRIATGLTFGYRQGPNIQELWETTGIELGLPIIYAFGESRQSAWIRWEPTYVVTSSRLVLAPRMMVEFPLWRLPFVARVGLDVKGVREHDPVVISTGASARI
jgi:hypothetical protein